MAGEAARIQRVVGQPCEILAHIEIAAGRRRGVAEAQAGMPGDAAQTDAHLAPVAELAPEVDAVLAGAETVLGEARAVPQQRHIAHIEARLRRDEPAAARVERLVVLGGDARLGSHLQVPYPLGAEVADVGEHYARGGVVGRAAAEVVLDAEPEPDVVRAPGVALGIEHDVATPGARLHRVVDALEIAAAMHLREGRIEPDRVRIVRHSAGCRGHGCRRPQTRLVSLRVLGDAHLADRQRCRLAGRRAASDIGRIIPRVAAQPRKPSERAARRLLAQTRRAAQHLEIERRRLAEHGLQQDVAVAHEPALRVAAAADGDGQHLVGDRGHRLETGALAQREADIHHDQHIDAHGPRHLDRQVVGQTAVDQQPAVDVHRSEHARRGDAGAQSRDEVAAAELHGVARLEVGGHGTERCRQLVEVAHRSHRQRALAQRLGQTLTADQGLRQPETAGLDAEREVDEEVPVLALATEAAAIARARFAERVAPLVREHERLDLGGAEAAGIKTAHHRAHAGAGDRVDADALRLEHLQHADVRASARTAAGEHEAHPRPRVGRSGCDRRRIGMRGGRGTDERDEGQQKHEETHAIRIPVPAPSGIMRGCPARSSPAAPAQRSASSPRSP